jgi:hypothetical protein
MRLVARSPFRFYRFQQLPYALIEGLRGGADAVLQNRLRRYQQDTEPMVFGV